MATFRCGKEISDDPRENEKEKGRDGAARKSVRCSEHLSQLGHGDRRPEGPVFRSLRGPEGGDSTPAIGAPAASVSMHNRGCSKETGRSARPESRTSGLPIFHQFSEKWK